MDIFWQNIIIYTLVALAATWLLKRTFKKKRKSCGGNCACPTQSKRSSDPKNMLQK